MVSPLSPAVVASLTEKTSSAPSSLRNAVTWSSSSCSSRTVAKILMGVVNVFTLIIGRSLPVPARGVAVACCIPGRAPPRNASASSGQGPDRTEWPRTARSIVDAEALKALSRLLRPIDFDAVETPYDKDGTYLGKLADVFGDPTRRAVYRHLREADEPLVGQRGRRRLRPASHRRARSPREARGARPRRVGYAAPRGRRSSGQDLRDHRRRASR